MKVLHVIEAVMSGTALHVRLLAGAQRRQGMEVVVAGPTQRSDGLHDDHFWGALGEAGVSRRPVDLHKFPLRPQNLAAARSLASLMRGERPCIVHSHGLIAGLIARPVARRLCIPAVHTPNGTRFAAARVGVGWLSEYALERMVAAMTARVVATSPSEADVLSRVYSRTSISVVPNALPAPTSSPPPMPEPARVVWVGRLASEKQPEAAVRILRMLRVQRPDVEAVIVGDGPRARAVESLIGDLDPGIRLLRRGVAGIDAIAQSTAVLMTSLREGGPYVPLEAMTLARPVVATDAAGCRDVVVHGETGYLYPIGADQEAVDRLVQLTDDRVVAERLGEAGLKRFMAEYTIERLVERVNDVYEGVLAKRSS